MGTWYISSDEVTWQTLAAAEVEDLSLTLRANGADEASFRVPGNMLAADLCAYGAPVVIKYDSTIRFRGRMSTLPREGVGAQEYVSYTAIGPWWWFGQITYSQQWQVMRSSDNTLIQVPKPRIVIGQDDSGNRRTLSEEIEAVIDYLIAKGAPILKGTIDSGPTAPYSEHTNMRCDEVILQCLRYMPDMVCYFDHGTSPHPTFHCRRIANLAAASVDLVNVDSTSLSLTPRYDIAVPGIRITYEQTHSVDGADYETRVLDVEGDTDDPRCVDLLFELSGSSITYMRQKIEVSAYPAAPYTDKAFWKGIFNWLEKVDDADFTVDAVARSGTENFPSFLAKGSIQEWMTGVDFEDEVWTVTVGYIRRNDSGQALETVESKELKVTLRSTDATTKEYRRVGAYEAAEDVPVGVATALYNSWSRLHWQGAVVLTEEEASFSIGPWSRLNITNGLSAWATMNAAVQEIEVDVDKGTTRAKMGPSGLLEAQSLVALFRACRARRFAWRAGARASALVTGSESDGAYSLPREKASEADPGEFKQIRVAADAAGHEQLIQLDPSGIAFEDGGDAAALTIAPREMWSPQANLTGQLVYKRRQMLASEPYHAEQLVGALIPVKELKDVSADSPDNGDALRWSTSLGKWTNSPVAAGGLDLSVVRLGYTVAGGTITLLSGMLKMHGKGHLSVAQSSASLGGTQFFYVHHVRGSGSAAWAVSAAEPGVSATDLDIVFYKFVNGLLSQVHRPGGDIDLDLPL